jgi:hypothetical protein
MADGHLQVVIIDVTSVSTSDDDNDDRGTDWK